MGFHIGSTTCQLEILMENNNITLKNGLLIAALAAIPEYGLAQSATLEETIVTAQRRVQSAQDIPIAITAVSAQAIADAKIDTSSQLAKTIPNVQVAMPFGETMPVYTIRGVTMAEYSLNQAGPIAMYTDDVYRGVAALQAFPLYDLNRVEVLRGPQGTLYGKNVTGGAINFITELPSLTDSEGYATFGVGDYGRLEAKGAYGAPLIEDVLAVRGALYYQEVDGYVENKITDEDASSVEDVSGRIALLYSPSDKVDFTFRLQHLSSDGTGPGTAQTNVGPEGIVWSGITREGLDFHETQSDLRGSNELENTLVSLTFNYAFSDSLVLTSITSYQDGSWEVVEDADGTPLNLNHNAYSSDVDQFTQEFRLAYDDGGAINGIAGLYASNESVEGGYTYKFLHAYAGDYIDENLNPIPNGINDCQDDFFTGCTVTSSYDQEKSSYAAFVHTNFNVTEALTLTAGIRYTLEEAELDKYRADNYYLDPETGMEVFDYNGVPGDGNEYLPKMEDDEDRWTGNVGLDYAISEEVLVYGAWTRSFRGGSYQVQGFYSPSEINFAKPEEVDSIELGLKGTYFDNRMRVNLAVFDYDYENQQFLNSDPTTFLYSLVNAPKSSIRGAELEIVYRPINTLTFNLGLGYLDSEYDELVLNGVDYADNEMINSPEYNINASVDWIFLQNDLGDFRAYLGGVYSDDQYYDAANTERFKEKGYGVLDGRIAFASSDDKYSVSLWMRNITDEEYYSYGFNNFAYFNFDYSQRGLPRMYGAEVTVRF